MTADLHQHVVTIQNKYSLQFPRDLLHFRHFFKTFTWWKRTRVDLFPVSLESKNTFQLYLVSLWTTRVEIFIFCCLFSHQLSLSITLAWCCKDSLILPYFFHFLFRHLTSCRPFSFSLIGRLVHYFDSFHLCTLVLSTRGQNW